jgi:hypothetical protein
VWQKSEKQKVRLSRSRIKNYKLTSIPHAASSLLNNKKLPSQIQTPAFLPKHTYQLHHQPTVPTQTCSINTKLQVPATNLQFVKMTFTPSKLMFFLSFLFLLTFTLALPTAVHTKAKSGANEEIDSYHHDGTEKRQQADIRVTHPLSTERRGEDFWTPNEPSTERRGEDFWIPNDPSIERRGEDFWTPNDRSTERRGEDFWTPNDPSTERRGEDFWTPNDPSTERRGEDFWVSHKPTTENQEDPSPASDVVQTERRGEDFWVSHKATTDISKDISSSSNDIQTKRQNNNIWALHEPLERRQSSDTNELDS